METINERQLLLVKYWQKAFEDGSIPKKNNVLIPLMIQIYKDINAIQGTIKDKKKI